MHFYDRIESPDVIFKVEKSDNTDNKICEIRLAVPGNDLFSKKQGRTFEEDVVETIAALEPQLKRIKKDRAVPECQPEINPDLIDTF